MQLPRTCLIALSILLTLPLRGAGLVIPEWDPGYRGEIPEVPVAVEVDAAAIESRGHEAIQEAIDSVDAPGAVLLPEGVFELHGAIALRSGVVLRGAGASRTHLKFHSLPGDSFDGAFQPAFGSIRLSGKRRSREYPIRNGFKRGSRELTLEDPDGLEPGQMILVFSENDPELMYTDERWNVSWAAQSLAQIVEITAVEGDRIRLDVPLRLTYKEALRPRILVIEPIRDAGIEDLKIENLDPDGDNIIGVENARNCWVRRCETVFTSRGHVWLNFSRFITISGNEMHHSFNYGGGGRGYGMVAGNVSTDCLFTDNILHHLRHAMMAKRGSSGNVFSYNYSFERRRDPEGDSLLCDISIHGHYSYQNLFEGNVVEFIELADYWGPTGPRTTFLRNQVQTRISIQDHSDGSVFLGNYIVEGGFETDGTSTGLVFAGNRTGNGDSLPSSLEVRDVPDSAYRTTPPANWGSLPWPVLGPDEPEAPLIPAQRRWIRRQEH